MTLEAWLVRYTHYGKEQKFITMDKTRAIEYAAQHNGSIKALFDIDNAPAEAKPANQCDGCVQGATLDGSLHRDTAGRSFMVCQAYRYTTEETK